LRHSPVCILSSLLLKHSPESRSHVCCLIVRLFDRQGLVNASVTVCTGPPTSSDCVEATVLESSSSSVAFVLPGNSDSPAVATRFRACDSETPTLCSDYVDINTPDVWWVQGDDSSSAAPRSTQGGWIRVYVASLLLVAWSTMSSRLLCCILAFASVLSLLAVNIRPTHPPTHPPTQTPYSPHHRVC
jgi:hypothetical protein